MKFEKREPFLRPDQKREERRIGGEKCEYGNWNWKEITLLLERDVERPV